MDHSKEIKLDGNIFGIALNYKCLYQTLQKVLMKNPM